MALLSSFMLPACLSYEQVRLFHGFYRAEDLIQGQCRPRAEAPLVTVEGGPAPMSGLEAFAALPGSRYLVRVPGFGSSVQVSIRGGAAIESAAPVGARSPLRVGTIEAADPPPRVPGFFAGIDLRPYRSIAFLIDTTLSMCGELAGGQDRFVLDSVAEEVTVTLLGIPLETRLSLISSGGTEVRQIWPNPDVEGRRMAMEWMCGILCGSDGRLTLGLRRAIEMQPDVIVAISSDAIHDLNHLTTINMKDGDPSRTADALVDPVVELARHGAVPPIIGVFVGWPSRERDHDNVLHRLAAATGGFYATYSPR